MAVEDNNKKRAREEAKRKADQYCAKDGGPPDPAAAREELAGLDRIEYGQRREDLAAELGIMRGLLDEEYKAQRKAAESAAAAAAPKSFLGKKDPEPWEEEVDGDALLDEIVLAINKHLVTQDGAAEVAALWTVFTHAINCFHIAPLLAVTSPTIECGKTTLLTLLGELVPHALSASNITAAALFRAMDKWHPCLLVDEADTFLLKDNEELRGVLNSGHRRGNPVIRTTGDSHDPVPFDTWGAKAIALVGKLPPSLTSRSIHIQMKRKRAAEKVVELRLDRLGHLVPIHRRIARWVKDNEKALQDADPSVPDEVHGRCADNWRPLLAIADIAGAEWPRRTREIAVKVSGRGADDSWGILLLEDLARLFAEKGVDRMASISICEALAKLEERPWAEYGDKDKPLTQPKLAALLKPFGIVPTTVRFESRPSAKGYKLEQLRDAISRYILVEQPETAVTAVTPLQALETKEIFKSQAVIYPPVVTACNVTRSPVVTACNGKKPKQGNGCNGVTVVTAKNDPCESIPPGEVPADPAGLGAQPAWHKPTIDEETPTPGSDPRSSANLWDVPGGAGEIPDFMDRRKKP